MTRAERFGWRPAAGVAAAGAALALLAGCAGGPDPTPVTPAPASAAAAPAGLTDYYDQQLTWSECQGGMECAELTVPLDYTDPGAGDTTVAVLRTPDAKPLGALVVNPGGPGGSGVDYAAAASRLFSDAVTDNYQIVGFDPRGVGRSAPVDCLTDRQLDRWIAADADPATTAEEQQLLDAAGAFGRRCERRSSAILGHVDTASVVKDLDVLRAALDQDRLNYLGFSYGSSLGARYADEFGASTGRMVLDGILPPQLTAAEIGKGQAQGFEEALRRFVQDCQAKDDCPVAGDSVDAGVARIQKLLADTGRRPLPTDSGRDLSESLALGAILYHLYFPFAGDWDSLRDGLRDAFAGDGTTLLDLYDRRLERDSSGNYANNSQEAFYAVNCLDRDAPTTVAELRQRADDWAQAAPTFGRYLAWSEAACAAWPEDPAGGPQQVSAVDAGPILVIGNRHDPATPLPWAQLLVDRLADAHLVIWEADGHTAYGNGSTCVDDAVDAYLVAGDLPAEDPLVCS